MHNKKLFFAVILIFLSASYLRLHLAFVNRDANDNHFKVIRIISLENRVPGKDEPECLQCYHPKLYHYLAAKAINLILEPSTDTTDEQKIISQMINALAGIVTLFIIYRFLGKLELDASSRLITFGLVALNPALIGINAQATNDTFVILFSTLALFFFWKYLNGRRTADLLLVSFSTTLAALSKGSGLLIFLGILAVFLAKIISSHQDIPGLKKYSFGILIFFFVTFSGIVAGGPYAEYYFAYGTPFVINKPVSSMPKFFTRTYEGDKTGVTSIYDAYFTFRFVDLLKHPYLNRESDPEKYTLNRMSVWTQLFARANFIQFEGTPKKWLLKPTNPIFNFGKVIFIFALVPLVIFLWGVLLATWKAITNFWKKRMSFFSLENDWLFVFFFWMFFAFIIKFTLDYRDFVTMKPIYLFPGLLAFVYIFSLGFDTLYEKIKKSILLKYGLHGSIAALLLLYILDIAYLLEKLS